MVLAIPLKFLACKLACFQNKINEPSCKKNRYSEIRKKLFSKKTSKVISYS